MKKLFYMVASTMIFIVIPGGIHAGYLSVSVKYGHSILFTDYSESGSAASSDINLSFNPSISAGFQFSYNIYQPLPACEVFAGDCRWDGRGDFTISEFIPYLRFDLPRIGLIPARAFFLLGPGYFDLFQDVTYSRREEPFSETRALRVGRRGIGFVMGAGLIFDDYRGLSVEFSPVIKLVDDIYNHLDIYMGVRYLF